MHTHRIDDHMDVDEIEELVERRGTGLEELMQRARELRDLGLRSAGRDGVITYSRKVFVPLTTLCRDRCHYCAFVDTPSQLLKKGKPMFMSAEQVLAVAKQGALLGCKEALLTLGDRPEDRWPEAREWLDVHGYTSTIEYVAAMAELITCETGMLAHANPGVMTVEELRRLRPVAPSMGMMLETTSRALFEQRGQVHYGSADKDPALRLEVIENAGRLSIPFTTGLLVGIGETARDRADSLAALRDAHERHGHIQEVIIQNFRAKPRTAMQDVPDAEEADYLAMIAAARCVFGPGMRIQVPPNLSDPSQIQRLLDAGADDWGGVSPLTADHVNPERPWPQLAKLDEYTASAGFTLRERLTAHPEFVLAADRWIDGALHTVVDRLAEHGSGLAGIADDGGILRPAPTPTDGWPSGGDVSAGFRGRAIGKRRLVQRAADDATSLDDQEWCTLLAATGDDLEELVRVADDVRRYTVGEAISFVPNRNLTSSGFRTLPDPAPDTFGLADVATITVDAWELGASEICIQGRLPAEEDPSGYVAIARAAKTARPGAHLHAYRPQDIADFADRSGASVEHALLSLRAAGVDSIPGTGVKILDDGVRRQVAPDDLAVDRWIDIVSAAHRLGFRTSSVMFFGHAETAAQRVQHLRTLRRMQEAAEDAGGAGFTELVPIPLDGGASTLVADRSTHDDSRATFAVARLMLTGSISHLQVAWTRVGLARAGSLLRSGADDLGGTLFDGRVMPATGVERGHELSVRDAVAAARAQFRPLRQRTTEYGEPRQDRKLVLR